LTTYCEHSSSCSQHGALGTEVQGIVRAEIRQETFRLQYRHEIALTFSCMAVTLTIMVKLNPKKREQVAFWFFEQRMNRDAEQYVETGESAVRDYIPSGKTAKFDSAIKELETIGCLHEVLFCNLYRLKHATDQYLPKTRRMRAAAAALANVAADIRELQRANIPEVLLPAYPHTETASLLANPHFPRVLDECAQLLGIW
jgi:hypothetical protein